MKRPKISVFRQDPQTEEIYNVNTLLLILSIGIVWFCNLMHLKSDKAN